MDQFRGLFSKLDQNEDGFVSVAELQDEMRKHGIISADGKVQVTNILNSIGIIIVFLNLLLRELFLFLVEYRRVL